MIATPSPTPLIIGSGLAGMATALQLAARGIASRLITRSHLGAETSSGWAQGGIAAAVGADDSPELHTDDTLQAGAGLCDPAIAALVCRAAPAAIRQLEQWGVAFDRDAAGYKLGLEGAHSRRRILHVQGDGSGAAIVRALAAQVQAASLIEVVTGAVMGLAVGNGVWLNRLGDEARAPISDPIFIPGNAIILATGGAGALWQETTNPLASCGHGLALALQAGAVLRDLEFMQFHPTALDIGRDPMPLLSEALRGEGAVLIDQNGARILDSDLAPRDVVSRAIAAQLQRGSRVFLDCRAMADFTSRFPAIAAICHSAGLDPARDPLPVRPAAHYHMGGVAVDDGGRSSVSGLYAVGEVACTGLHGANRLASNSLLEAAVMAERVAEAVATARSGKQEAGSGKRDAGQLDAYQLDLALSSSFQLPASVRSIMSAYVGVVRTTAGLRQAITDLKPLATQSALAQVALRIVESALARRESVGAHYLEATSQNYHVA
jgi:L-aspartate oxidase